MTTKKQTKSQIEAANIAALIRARASLIWIVTKEEARVERYIVEAATAAGYRSVTWDIGNGCQGAGNTTSALDQETADPDNALEAVRRSRVRTVWIMRDLLPWISGPAGAATQRKLRNLARSLPTQARDLAQAIVVLSTGGDIPPELSAHATVIEWPFPDRREIEDILNASLEALPSELRSQAIENGGHAAAIDAAIGLTGEEAASCFARSLVKLRKIDPAAISAEKRRLIAREKVLDWTDPLPGGLSWVGGLENLKGWLQGRAIAFSQEAREYGLPSPKGALLVGVPGCGKTLIAKAISTAWGVPLIRFDLNSLKSKYVGESEAQLRKALRVIEAIGKCVVWIDEIEKAMQGATSGSSDGGVSSDALGTVLSWMQDRQGDAFVIATANDVQSLPPELLRKGRFDDVWFVDLPTGAERISVLQAALRQYKRDHEKLGIDANAVARETAGFTGSEIASLVPDAMFVAFSDNAREITTADLIAAAATVTPLSKTADSKITRLRQWAKGRARLASTPEAGTEKAEATLDL